MLTDEIELKDEKRSLFKKGSIDSFIYLNDR
jgi:hypothetical protein